MCVGVLLCCSVGYDFTILSREHTTKAKAQQVAAPTDGTQQALTLGRFHRLCTLVKKHNIAEPKLWDGNKTCRSPAETKRHNMETWKPV